MSHPYPQQHLKRAQGSRNLRTTYHKAQQRRSEPIPQASSYTPIVQPSSLARSSSNFPSYKSKTSPSPRLDTTPLLQPQRDWKENITSRSPLYLDDFSAQGDDASISSFELEPREPDGTGAAATTLDEDGVSAYNNPRLMQDEAQTQLDKLDNLLRKEHEQEQGSDVRDSYGCQQQHETQQNSAEYAFTHVKPIATREWWHRHVDERLLAWRQAVPLASAGGAGADKEGEQDEEIPAQQHHHDKNPASSSSETSSASYGEISVRPD